jgi:Baseplate hub gp41
MLFDRVYRLLVGKKGQEKGIEITDLRIEFEIEKSAKKNPNKSSIKIYNLTEATRTELEKPGTRCVLYAGYKDQDGPQLIFNGDVTFAWTQFKLPNVITEFELGDGASEIRDTTISVGYDKGVKSKQILNDAAKKMDTPLVIPSNLEERVWEHGLSFFGPVRTLLDKVTKGSKSEWSIQNGNLQVIEKGMVTTRQGIVLSADSGLIGSPERERGSKDGTSQKEAGKATVTNKAKGGAPRGPAESLPVPPIPPIANIPPNASGGIPTTFMQRDSEDDAFDDAELERGGNRSGSADERIKSSEPVKSIDGWKVKCLLMPSLNPGDRVQLDSRSVKGIFRVQELKHKGDNWEGDWQTELKLIDPAEPLVAEKSEKGSKGGKAKRGGESPGAGYKTLTREETE